MTRTRTFIAVDPGPAIRDRIVALQENLARTGADVKWVEAENLHATLLFLGEVADRDLTDICRLVSANVAERPAFALSVETAGCFPDPRRPRVLWVGIGEGAESLCAIHDSLELPLMDRGYRRENRKFTPHITLGRVKSDRASGDLTAALAKKANWRGGETVAREILVMGSVLTSKGPTYAVLSRAKLKLDAEEMK